jgi:hypothetical protein
VVEEFIQRSLSICRRDIVCRVKSAYTVDTCVFMSLPEVLAQQRALVPCVQPSVEEATVLYGAEHEPRQSDEPKGPMSHLQSV